MPQAAHSAGPHGIISNAVCAPQKHIRVKKLTLLNFSLLTRGMSDDIIILLFALQNIPYSEMQTTVQTEQAMNSRRESWGRVTFV